MATPRHSLRRFFRRTGGLIAAVAVAGLGACSAYEKVTDVFSEPVVLACPAYRVVADAAQVVQFRPGDGRDLVDVDFDGRIADVKLECTSRVDKKTREGTEDVAVTLVIDARRGPANTTHKAVFPYFISVVGDKRKIYYREAFSVSIEFPGNRTQVRFRSPPVTLELPISKRWSNRSFTIFAGLKLNHEQLEFNRGQKAEPAK